MGMFYIMQQKGNGPQMAVPCIMRLAREVREMIRVNTKRLFGEFLASGGGARLLSPREREIAQLIVNGVAHQSVAKRFSLPSKNEVGEIVRKILRLAMREAACRERAAEVGFLIAELKAARKPLAKIPIEGLFPARLEVALCEAGTRTLGDIVAKGRRNLLRSKSVRRDVDIRNIRQILAHFGAKLPE